MPFSVDPSTGLPAANNINPGGAEIPYAPSAGGPVAPGTPPAPDKTITVGGNPGYTPNYTSAIQGDPGYVAAQGTVTAQDAQAAAQRKAALQALVVKYGGLPSGFTDQYGDIDQATLDAAQNNQYSTLAQLKNNYNQSVQAFKRALAARGALQSGDLNYGQDQLDQGYGQSQYDDANTFGDTVNSDLASYLGTINSGQGTLANAVSAAESNQEANPANNPVAPTPGQTATLDHGRSAQAGQPIYTMTDGNGNVVYYDINGNPWTPPTDLTDPTNQRGFSG